MAGDWIKMRDNLWDDPRVAKIVDMTDSSEAAVIGSLYWLWSTADQHTEDGFMPGITLRAIDRKTGLKGFSEAMCSIGWLEEKPDGVLILEFEKHNGESAKKRAQTARRVAKHYAANAKKQEKTTTYTDTTNAPLTQEPDTTNAPLTQDALPREEKSNTPHTPHGGLSPTEVQPEQPSAVTTEHTEPAQPVAIVADTPEQSAIVADGEPGDKGTAQTVAAPPVAAPPPGEVRQLRRKTRESGAVSMADWIAAEKSAGRKPIPDDDPVFDYAQKAGIPDEMLSLAWVEFRARYRANPRKRYTDWRAVFRNAVRGNWFKLWFFDETGAYRLTTAGRQAEAVAA